MQGRKLRDDYTLNTSIPYNFTTQLRNSKQSKSSKETLKNRRSNVGTVTFMRNLEVSDTYMAEYDKNTFLMALNNYVGIYGLYYLFSMPDTSRKIHSLVEDARLFSLTSVSDKYDTHMVCQIQVFELDSTRAQTTTESSASIQSRTNAYNEYEQYNITLSRLIVESVISPSYCEILKTRFSHHNNYEELPGHVYFMIVLDVCNSSADIGIDNAQVKSNKTP